MTWLCDDVISSKLLTVSFVPTVVLVGIVVILWSLLELVFILLFDVRWCPGSTSALVAGQCATAGWFLLALVFFTLV